MAIERNTTIILQQDATPFTTMFNDVLQGITHTGALGVYCYLASKPPGWNINKNELKSHFKCGTEHINTCIQHLKIIGVLEIMSIRNEKGQIEKWVWNLRRHIPKTPIHQTQTDETHSRENPLSGDTASINKKIIEIKDNTHTTAKTGKSVTPATKSKNVGSRFNEFWNLYPKKKGKSICIAKWRSLNLDYIADMILAKLQDQVARDHEWSRGFAPNPLTYINQERWDDEITLSTSFNKNNASQTIYDDTDTSWIEEMKSCNP